MSDHVAAIAAILFEEATGGCNEGAVMRTARRIAALAAPAAPDGESCTRCASLWPEHLLSGGLCIKCRKPSALAAAPVAVDEPPAVPFNIAAVAFANLVVMIPQAKREKARAIVDAILDRAGLPSAPASAPAGEDARKVRSATIRALAELVQLGEPDDVARRFKARQQWPRELIEREAVVNIVCRLRAELDALTAALGADAAQVGRRHDPAIERAAKAIYDAMPYDEKGVKPAWVPHGNSLKQDEARALASEQMEPRHD